MRNSLLSLILLASISLVGNAKESTTTAFVSCTPCGTFSDQIADAGGDAHDAYMYCFENLNPCPIELDPVVIKG